MTEDATGLVPERLAHLKSVIEDDIERRRYWGAVITVARGGKIGLHAAIGSADAAGAKPLAGDSVFSIFSVTKAFTNVIVLKAIEDGRFALTTKISEIIPEFSGGHRQHITFFHLLTHTSGLPMLWSPRPGMNLDIFDDIVAATIAEVHSMEPPGERVAYSPMMNHVLMGEALRRTDPKRRSYRDMMNEDLLQPLGMHSTAVGVRRDLKERHVIPDFRNNYAATHHSSGNLGVNGAFEEELAEMPWVGIVSTVPDMFRLAEMLRHEGTLDGKRILSPAILRLARRNWTGDKPNELYRGLFYKRHWTPGPAYMGLGFAVRGTAVAHHLFGTLTSPETFGNYGAGTALFWVDPAADLTFVCLTAGLMESTENIERFQRLSDIAVSACV
ncbi:MAG TPA: serine hydrolase domain-containing protein [Stellaceae bacterium]|nr:serine hydrolase domain-containing protein [Stellaceae bacterium]